MTICYQTYNKNSKKVNINYYFFNIKNRSFYFASSFNESTNNKQILNGDGERGFNNTLIVT